jgi:hypothetical protein
MNVTKHKLSSVKDKLLSELSSIKFIQPCLEKILNKPYYNTVILNNIAIHFIPTKEVSVVKIKTILKRLDIVYNFFNMTSKIKIWFVPCNIKRIFPKHNEPIDQEHINGAYTYPSNHTVFIYRLDEFPKVLIHEVLHNSILDTNIPYEKELYHAFSIDTTNCNTYCNTQLRVNEAVIEAWALLVHLLFVSQDLKKSYENLFQEELNWSLYLCNKLKHYQETKYPTWTELTHSYSYIRLKTCILFFRNEFMKLQYPYRPKEIIDFFKKYNLNSSFIAAIKNAKDYKTDSFNMTIYGNY